MYTHYNPVSKFRYQVREIDLDHDIYMEFCYANFNDDDYHYVGNAICFKSDMDQQTFLEFLNND